MPDQNIRARTSASTYSPFPLLTEETAAILVNAYIRFIVDSYIACVKHVSQHSVPMSQMRGGESEPWEVPPEMEKRGKKNVPIVPNLIEHLSNVKRDGTPL